MKQIVILYSRFDETLDYAVEEFTKYTERMSGYTMTVTGRHVPILPRENEEGVIRFGLLSDLGLDDSCVEDPVLDDVIDIDITGNTGYIAGSNIRSILLGVYRWFRSAGARWVRPGDDGEVIPVCDLSAHALRYRHAASCRFRGECIEGAVSLENVLDTIVWSPKVGFNMFFIQQIVPFNMMSRWYFRRYNTRLPADPRTFEEIEEYTVVMEKQIKKCGLQLHSMGHGYLYEPYGIHYHTSSDHYEMNDAARAATALVNGKREFRGGCPNWTQLCYSNPQVRQDMVSFCLSYMEKKPYIDFLHLWLGDANKNHCECEECRRRIPSDFYVMFLNELWEEMKKRGITTRVVFILYNDTVFPPETVRLAKDCGFVLMTAFSRDYSKPYTLKPYEGKLPEYERNVPNVPSDFRVQDAFCRAWREQYH